jgi:hypothetical protein
MEKSYQEKWEIRNNGMRQQTASFLNFKYQNAYTG